MKSPRFVSLVIGCCFWATAAHADPILWTLDGVAFHDGATASGSFVFDADTGAYSSIAVTTTAGPVLPGTAYTNAHPDAARRTATNLQLVEPDDRDGSMALALVFFASPLSNAGGTVVLEGQFEGVCSGDGCAIVTRAESRQLTAGSLIGTPVSSVDLGTLIDGLLGSPPSVGGQPISTQTGADMTGPNQNANEGRLGAFIDRLIAAEALATVDLAAACDELDSAAMKVDPASANPWFVGPVADELLSQIGTISTDLGCP